MKRAVIGLLAVLVVASFAQPGAAAPSRGEPHVGKVAVAPDAHIPEFSGKEVGAPANPAEVSGALADPTAFVGQHKFWLAIDFLGFFYYFQEFENKVIWGHTAAILVDLLTRLGLMGA